MTALHHEALSEALRAQPMSDRLVVMPLLDESQVGPASIDLRLGTHFLEARRLETSMLDPQRRVTSGVKGAEKPVVVPLGRYLWLHPGHFVLGSTLEYIRMPAHLVGQVLGRSSWARMGLIVATAVLVQPGYSGVLTLELANIGDVPLKVYPGLCISQLVVWNLAERTKNAYKPTAKYVAPIGPEESRLDLESGDRDRLERIGKALGGHE